MMRIFTASILLVISFAFIRKENLPLAKISTPPGTVMLKEGLFIDREEVSNSAWREYNEGWILGVDGDTELYKKNLPDSGVWYSMRFDRERYVNNYNGGAAFDNYPVVGITYDQAVAFCEWRTERVNEYLQKTPGASFKSVTYRLPTEKEWELAASGKLDTAKYPYGMQDTMMRIKGQLHRTFNCYYNQLDSLNEYNNQVGPVDFSVPNAYGAYNMIGNVAEMVAEKGLAKGGHYELPLDFCKIREEMSYAGPNRFLGFRCICETSNVFSSKEKIKEMKKEQKDSFKKQKPSRKVKGFAQQGETQE
ncbi:MAG: SUMF1/EgtB/PvdO family nonheme iron enzyme [Bacteroidota bacterium]|nr:SUMF1/EgtB/PvdO family nonheme iron enzyme [Bacteroidota bacterium]